MENSKVKAMFVAQYWAQFIGIEYERTEDYKQTVNHTSINKIDYLLIRTVDQLTGEELAVVKEILSTKEKPNPTDIEIGQYCTHYYSYLRLIGILLPFTYLDENGKPQTLQPDEIIAKGWAKIQQP